MAPTAIKNSDVPMVVMRADYPLTFRAPSWSSWAPVRTGDGPSIAKETIRASGPAHRRERPRRSQAHGRSGRGATASVACYDHMLASVGHVAEYLGEVGPELPDGDRLCHAHQCAKPRTPPSSPKPLISSPSNAPEWTLLKPFPSVYGRSRCVSGRYPGARLAVSAWSSGPCSPWGSRTSAASSGVTFG